MCLDTASACRTNVIEHYLTIDNQALVEHCLKRSMSGNKVKVKINYNRFLKRVVIFSWGIQEHDYAK